MDALESRAIGKGLPGYDRCLQTQFPRRSDATGIIAVRDDHSDVSMSIGRNGSNRRSGPVPPPWPAIQSMASSIRHPHYGMKGTSVQS